MYWLSTKSPRAMFRPPDYQTPELAATLREAQGVDPALLAESTGTCAPQIRAYQRRLGLREITNPRKATK